jgi:hypothetical protein
MYWNGPSGSYNKELYLEEQFNNFQNKIKIKENKSF